MTAHAEKAADRQPGMWILSIGAHEEVVDLTDRFVTNKGNETIGKIDDLLVSSDGKDPHAGLSIGGFLGVGSHFVAAPYDSLTVVAKTLCSRAGPRSLSNP